MPFKMHRLAVTTEGQTKINTTLIGKKYKKEFLLSLGIILNILRTFITFMILTSYIEEDFIFTQKKMKSFFLFNIYSFIKIKDFLKHV
jgi:hypothetical protein